MGYFDRSNVMAFGGGFVKKENDGYLGKKLRLEKPKNQFPETPIKAQNPYYDAIFCIGPDWQGRL